MAERLARATAAVEPYGWQQWTPEALVRRVLAAVDLGLADDDRLAEVVTSALDSVAWRSLTVAAVCRQLLRALDDWGARELAFDLELAWLLEKGA